MSMPSRSSREHAEKPDASSDEHTSRQQSPASNPSQHSADSSRDMPIGGAGIDFQPPPSLKMPRSSPKRQVVVAKVSSPENSERRRRVDTDQRQQQQQQHRQPSSRPPAPWAIHEGQGQHPQQQQYPPYQAGAMPFSVPRSQQQSIRGSQQNNTMELPRRQRDDFGPSDIDSGPLGADAYNAPLGSFAEDSPTRGGSSSDEDKMINRARGSMPQGSPMGNRAMQQLHYHHQQQHPPPLQYPPHGGNYPPPYQRKPPSSHAPPPPGAPHAGAPGNAPLQMYHQSGRGPQPYPPPSAGYQQHPYYGYPQQQQQQQQQSLLPEHSWNSPPSLDDSSFALQGLVTDSHSKMPRGSPPRRDTRDYASVSTPDKKPGKIFRSPPSNRELPLGFQVSPNLGYGSFGMIDTPGGTLDTPGGTLVGDFSPMGPSFAGLGEDPVPSGGGFEGRLNLSRSDSGEFGAPTIQQRPRNNASEQSPFGNNFINEFSPGFSGSLPGVPRSPVRSGSQVRRVQGPPPSSQGQQQQEQKQPGRTMILQGPPPSSHGHQQQEQKQPGRTMILQGPPPSSHGHQQQEQKQPGRTLILQPSTVKSVPRTVVSSVQSEAKPRKLWQDPSGSAGAMRLELGSRTTFTQRSLEGINSMMRSQQQGPMPNPSAMPPQHYSTPSGRPPQSYASQHTASAPPSSGRPHGAPHPGAPHPGANHPGAPHPGAPHPGAPQARAPHPGAPHPSAPHPGVHMPQHAQAAYLHPVNTPMKGSAGQGQMRHGQQPPPQHYRPVVSSSKQPPSRGFPQAVASAPVMKKGDGKENPAAKPPVAARRGPCNCKKSKCLKLYCECFSQELYCDGCNCVECNNIPSFSGIRDKAIKDTRAKNADAFKPRITGGHNMGCKCKKSECLKKYCECFQAGVLCSSKCKCNSCMNKAGSQKLIDKRRKMKDTRGAAYAMRVAEESWKGAHRQRPSPAGVPPHLRAPLPSSAGGGRPSNQMMPHMMRPSPPGSHGRPQGPPGGNGPPQHYMPYLGPAHMGAIGYSPMGVPPITPGYGDPRMGDPSRFSRPGPTVAPGSVARQVLKRPAQKITPGAISPRTPGVRRAFDPAQSRKKRRKGNIEEDALPFFGSSLPPQTKTAALVVFSFLANQEVHKAAQVCRNWKRLATDEELWQLA